MFFCGCLDQITAAVGNDRIAVIVFVCSLINENILFSHRLLSQDNSFIQYSAIVGRGCQRLSAMFSPVLKNHWNEVDDCCRV